jgi:hypothetical protein
MRRAARRCKFRQGGSSARVSDSEPSGGTAIGKFQALSATQRRLYVCRSASRRSGTERFREAFDRIQPEVIAKAMACSGQLIDRSALAYARRFSVEELNAGTELYRSPVGHKLLSSTVTIADIVNGTISAPTERVQTARALIDILKQTDPFTAALGTPAQTYYLPNAAGGADDATERTDPSPEDDAAARFETWPHLCPRLHHG